MHPFVQNSQVHTIPVDVDVKFTFLQIHLRPFTIFLEIVPTKGRIRTAYGCLHSIVRYSLVNYQRTSGDLNVLSPAFPLNRGEVSACRGRVREEQSGAVEETG